MLPEKIVIGSETYHPLHASRVNFAECILTIFDLGVNDRFLICFENLSGGCDYITANRHVESTLEKCTWVRGVEGVGLCSKLTDSSVHSDAIVEHVYEGSYFAYAGTDSTHHLDVSVGIYECALPGTVGYKGPIAVLRYDGTDVNGFVDLYFGSQISGEDVFVQ